MHFWHKWKTVMKREGKASYSGGVFSMKDRNVIAEIECCEKCGKERGFIYFQDGSISKIHPDFIRTNLKGEKE